MNTDFFRDGNKVKLSSHGLEQGLEGADNSRYEKTSTGVVVGAQCGSFIKVLRGKRKSAARYHASFWVLI